MIVANSVKHNLSCRTHCKSSSFAENKVSEHTTDISFGASSKANSLAVVAIAGFTSLFFMGPIAQFAEACFAKNENGICKNISLSAEDYA